MNPNRLDVSPNPNGLDVPTNPSALDAQDRLRDLERQRAHEELGARLGDRSPGAARHSGFSSPTTDYAPDVPDAHPALGRER